MKTLKQLNEGIEKLVKDKNLDNYIDPELSHDVYIKIEGKDYKINIYNSINLDVKVMTNTNKIELDDDTYIIITKDTLKKVATSPFNKEYRCKYYNKDTEKDSTFVITKDIKESLIYEDKSDVLSVLKPAALMGALAINPILGLCFGLAMFTGLGEKAPAKLKSLFADFKKAKDDKDDANTKQDKEASKDKDNTPVNKKTTEFNPENMTEEQRKHRASMFLALGLTNNMDEDGKDNYLSIIAKIHDDDGNLDINAYDEFLEASNGESLNEYINAVQKNISDDGGKISKLIEYANSASDEEIKDTQDIIKTTRKEQIAKAKLLEKQQILEDEKKKYDQASDEEKEKMESSINDLQDECDKLKEDYETKSTYANEKRDSFTSKLKKNHPEIEKGFKEDTPKDNNPDKNSDSNKEDKDKEDKDKEDKDKEDKESTKKADSEKGDKLEKSKKETIKDPETGKKITVKVQRATGPQGGKKYRTKKDGKWSDWYYGNPTNEDLQYEIEYGCDKVFEGRIKTLKELI